MSRWILIDAQRHVLVATLITTALGCGDPAAPLPESRVDGIETADPAPPANEAPVGGDTASDAGDAASTPPATPSVTIEWTADGDATLREATPERLGDPLLEASPHGDALCFDGVDDGLLFDLNPIAGMSQFTIQVLFRPHAIGTPEAPSAQRFVHFEEGATTTPDSLRALIETRVGGDEWWLDTYLRAAQGDRTLIDPEKKHPVGRWYWAALTYGDGTMRHYVDGALELEGSVAFEPLGAGRASLGVRLNRVGWFKGCLRELRVSPSILPEGELAQLE